MLARLPPIGHEAQPSEPYQQHRQGMTTARFCMFKFNDFNTLLHCNILNAKQMRFQLELNAARDD